MSRIEFTSTRYSVAPIVKSKPINGFANLVEYRKRNPSTQPPHVFKEYFSNAMAGASK